MSPEDQRLAIAEACGWREAFPRSGSPHPETKRGGILLPYNWVNERTHERETDLPDYLNDLNAMHEAEKTLSNADKTEYLRALNRSDFSYRRLAFATAAQRAEAYLRTISKWED